MECFIPEGVVKNCNVLLYNRKVTTLVDYGSSKHQNSYPSKLVLKSRTLKTEVSFSAYIQIRPLEIK